MADPIDFWSLKLSDYLMVAATVIGPIAAVQAQKFVEKTTERKRRKLQIFYTLMATRATRVAPEHVSALNAIELEYGPSHSIFHRQTPADKRVVDTYRVYFDKLSENVEKNEASIKVWNDRCADLFVDLMFEMSRSTGYSFDKVTLRRAVYHPKGHVDTEMAQNAMRDFFLAVATGRASIPMAVTYFPNMMPPLDDGKKQ